MASLCGPTQSDTASAAFSITGRISDFVRADAYSAARSFIRGDIDVTGDLFAAIRWKRAAGTGGFRSGSASRMVRWMPRVESWLQSKARAARNIRFHYDRSNAFFTQFLDSRLVYSCAYFQDPNWSLDQAQAAKLDHICRKLDLRPGERFLDIGCGWGGLVLHAAERYGASATGCTLSLQQFDYARRAVGERGLTGLVTVHEKDYRDLDGGFDKIASVGMFEHVGVRRLPVYFRKVHALLADGGLFLNHGIGRPASVKRDAETLFLLRTVFPGGELTSLGDVARVAEHAGFEILDVENLRPHYALTCKAWVRNLQVNEVACLRAAGRETYRTWLLFLAAAALAFEEGLTDIYQVLMAKRSKPDGRRLTREYIYRQKIAQK
jgi:cyclopropane-fatty-acyl-phospholipid synthase